MTQSRYNYSLRNTLQKPPLKSNELYVSFFVPSKSKGICSSLSVIIALPESRKKNNQEAVVASHDTGLVQTEVRSYNVLKKNVERMYSFSGVSSGQPQDLLEFLKLSSISQKDLSRMIGVLWVLMDDSNIAKLDQTLVKIDAAQLLPEVFVTMARVLSPVRDRLGNWPHFILKGCSELTKYDCAESYKILEELMDDKLCLV